MAANRLIDSNPAGKSMGSASSNANWMLPAELNHCQLLYRFLELVPLFDLQISIDENG
jgi:hypothetical protein